MDVNHIYEKALIGIKHLLERRWFSRLWVAQEVALAPESIWVHSGTHSIHLDALSSLRSWGQLTTPSKPRLMHTVTFSNIITVVRFENMRRELEIASFADVLYQSWILACENPLDRVYAISAMSRPLAVEVDYSARCVDVYRKVTLAYLFDSKNTTEVDHLTHPCAVLAIAPLTKNISHSSDDWPTWTPDYNSMNHRCALTMTRLFNSSGYETIQVREAGHENYLLVAGASFGHVLSVLHHSDIMSSSGCDVLSTLDDQGDEPDEAMFAQWTQRCAAYLQQHEQSLASQCVLVKSLHHDFDARHIVPGPCTLNGESGAMHAGNYMCTTLMVLNLLCAGSEAAWPQLRSSLGQMGCLTNIDPYRLIAAVETLQGIFIGWVPATTKLDDQVCLFNGAPHPFVLRKATHSAAFTVVGDAWIPGVPHTGDIVEETDVEQWITLC